MFTSLKLSAGPYERGLGYLATMLMTYHANITPSIMWIRSERASEDWSMAIHEQGIDALHELAKELPEAEAGAGTELRARHSPTQLGEPTVRQEHSQGCVRAPKQSSVATTQIQPLVLVLHELKRTTPYDMLGLRGGHVSQSLGMYSVVHTWRLCKCKMDDCDYLACVINPTTSGSRCSLNVC